MNRKLGIISECIVGEDSIATLSRIQNAGFDSFFSGRCDIKSVSALKEKADKLGLCFEFLHAPFSGINAMWTPGEDYISIFNGMKEAVESASKCGINGIVAHVSSGWNPPEINDEGLKRYDELVAYAKEKNVVIAFENLRKVGNVAYFADRYANQENVKFCYDCGHEHCYTETVCFPDIFRERMIYTHIHDNFGKEKTNPNADGDMHVLPFDGDIDYIKMMRKLDEYSFKGTLMLEVGNNRYQSVSPDAFLKDAYSRIKKISEL